MQPAKRIPYGVSNFIEVITLHQYYVDKTMYLPLIEDEPDCLFFIRPRRFGKSLFVSMMRAYYDINLKDRFEELFSQLWIGQHPTPNQGAYQVLHFDFSRIGGGIGELERNFNVYCGQCIDSFIESYRRFYSEETVKQVKSLDNMTGKLNAIHIEAEKAGHKLYLIIDEYDNFTNVVLNEHGEQVYRALTHASGFYREVFKVFKGMFSRIFMTGVSPVTLDDLTSGFNIGWHISTNPRFNQMLGFSTDDVRQMLTYYQQHGKLPAKLDVGNIISDMKPWYNGYCFAEEALPDTNRVFNSDMVLYYLRHLSSTGLPPKQLLDPNTRTDYNKLKRLLQLDRLDGDRKGVLLTVAEEGQIVGQIEDSFPASALTDPDIFVSLLFYYGMLTIKGTFGAQLLLGIPNNNVRKQYYNYLLELYQSECHLSNTQLRTHFTYMAYDGKWQPALQFMAEAYGRASSVRDSIEGERNIQGFFMAYLSLNDYYITAPELELNHGFCDFFLLPDLTHYATRHSYILELKVIPHAASQAAADRLAEAQWQEAAEQIHRYAAAPRVEALRQGTTLHCIVIQFDGWKLHRMEEVMLVKGEV